MLRSIAASVAVVLMIVVVPAACTRRQAAEDQKRVDDLVVTVFYSRTPLVKGKNDLKITVADSSGRVVSDALIETRFSTTGPGGVQTSFMAPGELKDGVYSFAAEFSAAGDWKMDVIVNRLTGNKPPVATTFSFTVE